MSNRANKNKLSFATVHAMAVRIPGARFTGIATCYENV